MKEVDSDKEAFELLLTEAAHCAMQYHEAPSRVVPINDSRANLKINIYNSPDMRNYLSVWLISFNSERFLYERMSSHKDHLIERGAIEEGVRDISDKLFAET